MFKRIAVVSLVLVFGLSVFNVSRVKAASVGGWGQSPRRQIFNYLKIYYFYTRGGQNLSVKDGLSFALGIPPRDGDIKIANSEFNTILDVVDNRIKETGFSSWGDVIALVNEQLKEKDEDNFNSFRDKILNHAHFKDVIMPLIEGMADELGVDLNKSVTANRIKVYPLTEGNKTDAEREEDTATLKEFLTGWAMQAVLGKINVNRVATALVCAPELVDSFETEINDYFGGAGKFDKEDPQQLFSVLSFSLDKAFLEGFAQKDIPALTPKQLIATGRGSLVDELEALESSWLVKRNRFGEIGDNKGVDWRNIPSNLVNEYIKTRIGLAGDVQKKLNDFDYYGRDVSTTDIFEAGIIGSWVSSVFNKIREENFNPVSQQWTQDYTLDDAKNFILSGIKFGALLKDAINENKHFGEVDKLDLLADNVWGEHSRNLLNTYGNIAQVLIEKGIVESDDEAIEFVERLLPEEPDEEENSNVDKLGVKLINSINDLYDITGNKVNDINVFRNDRRKRSALAAFTSLIAEFVEYPKYYGLNGGAEDLESLVGSRIDMVNMGDTLGLPELVKNYMGKDNLDFDRGPDSGVYSFWNKILFAAVNNLGEEDGVNLGLDYVKKQLAARSDLREFLQEKDIIDDVDDRDIPVLNTFEQWISSSISGLEESLQKIKDVINKYNITRDNYISSLADAKVREALEEPEYVFPRNPLQDDNVTWTDDGPGSFQNNQQGSIDLGTECYGFGSPDEIATFPTSVIF